MIIKDIFAKDINREINGVVDVQDLSDFVIRQEIEEYVLTTEARKHLADFFTKYTESITQPTNNIGVWIQGFYGSGKSHFLKMIGYLLRNQTVGNDKIIDIFKDKIDDPALDGLIRQAISQNTDVISFQIDAQSNLENRRNKDGITDVLLKVFNNNLGYFGSIPWIAQLERVLDEKGLWHRYQQVYQENTGKDWKSDRKDYFFNQIEAHKVFATVNSCSEDEARAVFESAKENYHSYSPLEFSELLSKHIDITGKRIVFLVDEVSQYIGNDTNLLLNLQSIAESFSSHLKGKVWLIVTAQETIERIADKAQVEFSKIQARFPFHYSLASTHVNVVVNKRLLEKNIEAKNTLVAYYQTHDAEIATQLKLDDQIGLPFYSNENEFSEVYPLLPYHHKLISTIINQVITTYSQSSNLARGERTMLDVCHKLVKYVGEYPIGTFIQFFETYNILEEIIDTSIKRTIDQAKEEVDELTLNVLKTLFLLKAYEGIHPTLEVVTTLMVKDLDTNKSELRNSIRAALSELERLSLVFHDGEDWIFLTDDEVEINRTIKNTDIELNDVDNYLKELIFSEIYPNNKVKLDTYHNYDFGVTINNREYSRRDINCIIKAANHQDSNVQVGLITPKDVLEITLGETSLKAVDLITYYKQTEAYLRRETGAAVSPNKKKIHEKLREDQVKYRSEIRGLIEKSIVDAEVKIGGEDLNSITGNGKEKIDSSLKELVETVYYRKNYMDNPGNPDKIKEAVFSNEGEQLSAITEGHNKAALGEFITHIQNQKDSHARITLKSVVDYFVGKPYGWSHYDVALLGATACISKQIEIKRQDIVLDVSNKRELFDALTSIRDADRIGLLPLEQIDSNVIRELIPTVQKLFPSLNSVDEASLMTTVKDLAHQKHEWWKSKLSYYQTYQLPDGELVKQLTREYQKINQLGNESDVIAYFRAVSDDVFALIDSAAAVEEFLDGPQVNIFIDAITLLNRVKSENFDALDEEARSLIESVNEITNDLAPYSRIKDLPNLTGNIESKYKKELQNKQSTLMNEVQKQKNLIDSELDKKKR
jgi:hypothetical protein